mmetsp:Transcript_96631/g.278962  ORF Transcript_96631/g.278962 Transcript_96631/m.278962 type:complete len:267 (+) Transcript_96631:147-947(+)
MALSLPRGAVSQNLFKSWAPASSASISAASRRNNGQKIASLVTQATSAGCGARSRSSPVSGSLKVTAAERPSMMASSLATAVSPTGAFLSMVLAARSLVDLAANLAAAAFRRSSICFWKSPRGASSAFLLAGAASSALAAASKADAGMRPIVTASANESPSVLIAASLSAGIAGVAAAAGLGSAAFSSGCFALALSWSFFSVAAAGAAAEALPAAAAPPLPLLLLPAVLLDAAAAAEAAVEEAATSGAAPPVAAFRRAKKPPQPGL